MVLVRLWSVDCRYLALISSSIVLIINLKCIAAIISVKGVWNALVSVQ